jgi:folate-binding protein YgfZ
MSVLSFVRVQLNGADAEKFLQGQVTVDVSKLSSEEYRPTAISDLKGRIQYGLWLKRHSAESIDVVISSDQIEALQAHVKKYGAFSKFKQEAPAPVYPAIVDGKASFAETDQGVSIEAWQQTAIRQGQAWITASTTGLFQPQELRLHQRDGVSYDKGCYLGQEIIARLWFRAQPKHWLHLIQGQGAKPADGVDIVKDIQVVNAVNIENGWLALVVAKPAALETQLELEVLALPETLNGDVGRAK